MTSGLATIEIEGVEVIDWLPEEMEAWAMPELLGTAEFVEKHIELSGRDVAIPGPVDLSITPYMRGMFDVRDDPSYEALTVLFGTQLGKTLFLYGGLCADMVQRPGPRLLVMPTEPDAREVAGTTLREIVSNCEPLLAAAVDGVASLTKEGYYFRTGNLYFGWSNSAASLSRRALREVDYDEVGKFPPYVGRDADPISLGDKRLRTFRNTTGAKSVRVSSPTTRDDLICQSWEESDQRRFWVPCPTCGEYQTLVWSQVRWPHHKDGHSAAASEVEGRKLARYECLHCKELWNDAQRNRAVRLGVWARDGERVEKDGRVAGEAKRRGNHAGFHVNAVYSPFTTLSQLAGSWLRAKESGSLSRLQDFINNELGEFWEEKEASTEEESVRKHRGTYKRAKYDPGTGQVAGWLPERVQVVTACVDVQRTGFYVSARGWAFGLESFVLDARQIASEAELHRYLLTARFTDERRVMGIRLTMIDSGDRAGYVYGLVDAWRDIDLRPTKGRSTSGPIVSASPRRKDPRTGKRYSHDIPLLLVDTEYWKDWLALRLKQDEAGPGYLHLPDDVQDEYIRQLCSEHKIVDRKRGRGGRSARRPKKVWLPKSQGRANHYWDCEVGNCVAGELLNVRMIPDPHNPPPAPAPVKTDENWLQKGPGEAWI